MNKPCIICVDNEKTTLDALKDQLKIKFGYKYDIETIESGYEALHRYEELLKENTEIPLVICDHTMPDIKGDEVLSRIRKLSPDTVTVLLSSHVTLKDIKNAVNKARIFQLISKPLEIDDLNATIEDALRFFNDTKKRNDANKKLKKANNSIETILNSNKNYAVDKFKAVNEFENKIKNEVHTSLISIKTGIDTIQKRRESIEKENNEALERYIDSFEDYLSNVSNLITRLIDITKTSATKPVYTPVVSYEGFSEMLNKATVIKNDISESINEFTIKLNEAEKLFKKEHKKIVAWDDEKILLFDLDEVLFFSSENRNIIVTTKKGKYKVKKTISELEKILVNHYFFRCHKSFLINLKYVNKIVPWISYGTYMSTIEGCDCEIPISKNHLREMKRILGI